MDAHTLVYFHPDCLLHDTGATHPERADRVRAIHAHIKNNFSNEVLYQEAPLATLKQISRAHLPHFIRFMLEKLPDSGRVHLDPDTTISSKSGDAAFRAAGAVCAAIDAVIDGAISKAFCLTRPPGHHAERDLGRGFCIFGNVALAAMHAREIWKVDRIATIDWDVHHGNGTQQAFYDDPNVLTISIHQDGLFPAESGKVNETGFKEGKNFNINIPLPPGSGHGAYSATIERVVAPAVNYFKPQLILVPCGFDASVYDPLGRMLLTSESYRHLTKMLLALANDICDGKIVFSHEGGYSKRYVPFCGLATIEALSGIRTEITDRGIRDDLPGQELAPHQETLIDGIAKQVKHTILNNSKRLV